MTINHAIEQVAQTFETLAWLRTRHHVVCVRCAALFDLTAHRDGCADLTCGGCIGSVSDGPLGFVCPSCE